MTEQSLTWNELVKQQGPYFVEQVLTALKGAVTAIERNEVESTPLTEFQCDAILSTLTQQLAGMNRPGSMGKARASAVAMDNPEIRKKVAAKAEAKAQKMKRQKAAYKGHATRKQNAEAAADAEARTALSTELAQAVWSEDTDDADE